MILLCKKKNVVDIFVLCPITIENNTTRIFVNENKLQLTKLILYPPGQVSFPWFRWYVSIVSSSNEIYSNKSISNLNTKLRNVLLCLKQMGSVW